ncbi:hypothetical protein EDB92DRAFT_2107269 [Lactarius akahatsu]|uniref:Uncharacterized protein n=1 Tax=Lactarius akahatsu TaxID=416441 RepID=A0AAD4L6L2_9AGAM|nr:hypothetical protein EDB92DRAFT_2107269 [Lactarius akahatsu]
MSAYCYRLLISESKVACNKSDVWDASGKENHRESTRILSRMELGLVVEGSPQRPGQDSRPWSTKGGTERVAVLEYLPANSRRGSEVAVQLIDTIEIWGRFGPPYEYSKALMPGNKVYLRVRALGKTLTNKIDAIATLPSPDLDKCAQQFKIQKMRTTCNSASSTDKGYTGHGVNAHTSKPTFRPPKPGITEAVALITPVVRQITRGVSPRRRRGLFPLALGAKRRPDTLEILVSELRKRLSKTALELVSKGIGAALFPVGVKWGWREFRSTQLLTFRVCLGSVGLYHQEQVSSGVRKKGLLPG